MTRRYRHPGMGRPGSTASIAALVLALVLACPFGIPLAAEDTSSWFGGSVSAGESAFWASGLEPGYPDGWTWGSSAALSAALGVKGERSRAEVSVDLAALAGARASLAGQTAALQGMAWFPVTGGDGGVLFGLRTLWAKLDLGWASLEIGRQVLNFGRGAIWSPEDIFASLDLSGMTPDRRGTDALRLAFPLGPLSTLDILAAPEAGFSEGRYAARLGGALPGLDAGLLAAYDGAGGQVLAAGDVKVDLGPSWYVETLWSVSPDSADPLESLWDRTAFGLDWSVGDLVLQAEAYHNGGGAASITVTDAVFPSEWYAFAAAAWTAGYSSVSLSMTADLGGLAESGGPWRATLVWYLDASQNAKVALSADLVHGSFARASAAGWSMATQASLTVEF